MDKISWRLIRLFRGWSASLGASTHTEIPQSVNNIRKYVSSALYMSGKRAKDSFSYVKPDLDLDRKLHCIDKLQHELDLRGINKNVAELKKSWEFYKWLHRTCIDLEQAQKVLKVELEKLSKNTEQTVAAQQDNKARKLEYRLNEVKEQFKAIRECLWDLDDTLIPKLLALPNELDDRTPRRSASILKCVGTSNEPSKGKVRNHIEIGAKLGILEYRNPMQYYLYKEAALFELAVLGYSSSVLEEARLTAVAGPDFGRSFVVEASGLNPGNLSDVFAISNYDDSKGGPNRMHLVGGASLVSFLALHAKRLIGPKCFPLRLFASGRQYTPSPPVNSELTGLFDVCQSSAVYAFTMFNRPSCEDEEGNFDSLMDAACRLYDNVCDHYRVVLRPVAELHSWEKLRASFELWSPSLNRYLEVGHISACGDYFSKRLIIMHPAGERNEYVDIVCGTVLSVPRLIGCLLEQNPEKLQISSKVAEYVPVNR